MCLQTNIAYSHIFAGIIIVTDGVLGFTSPSNMHNAVNQMRGANTSCWVVQVGVDYPVKVILSQLIN